MPPASVPSIPLPGPSLWILLMMLLNVAAASLVFWLLVKRWTVWRRWAALSQWAAERGFELLEGRAAEVPEPLEQITPRLQVQTLLRHEDTTLLAAHSPAPQEGRVPPHAGHWHLLLRRMETAWPVSGLRPAAHSRSLIDLLGLSSYPSLIPPQRYVVFSTESRAARRLAESSLRALLPADVGLVLHGTYMILDFSPRPFDTIELDRMLALVDQLAAHVPVAQIRA